MANSRELTNDESVVIAAGIIAGLIGLATWCFGLHPKISLGISILVFFACIWRICE
jgi:ammonia channel protein AmtB